MLVRFDLAPRQLGVTPQQCIDHVQTAHATVARRIPHLVSLVQNQPALADGAYLVAYPGFDVCSELEFESPEAMDEGLASPIVRDELAAEEAEFLQDDSHSYVFGERHSLMTGWSPVAGAKRMWFLRAHPARGAGALAEAVQGRFLAALGKARLTRFDYVAADESVHAGRAPAAFDVVAEAWFNDLSEALAFSRSPAQVAADHSLAGLFSGRADWICTPYRIK